MTLAFVCVQLDTGPQIFQLISGQNVCHYLGGDKGGGGSRQTVTKCDKGGNIFGSILRLYFLKQMIGQAAVFYTVGFRLFDRPKDFYCDYNDHRD